jgi:hypothetical protein
MRAIILKKLFAAALSIALLAFISCEKNPIDDGQIEQPPELPPLPPAASMSVDLSLFTGGQSLAKSGEAQAGRANFTNAAIRVLIINKAVVAGLSAPVEALKAAISQKPKWDPSDRKFHWIFRDSSQTFEADLAGWTEGREFVFQMCITSTTHVPPLVKFLWYEGRANRDVTSGYWEFFDDKTPGANIKVLRIDWQHTAADNRTSKFSVVKPNVPENGDELTYSVVGAMYNLTFLDKSENTTLDIGWNAQTHAGYLIAPNYNNRQKACWDENLDDVVCPN